MDEITLELDPAYVGSAYSPQVEVSEVEGGHSVAITHDSPEGLVTQTFDVMDGEDGEDGIDALSWTCTPSITVHCNADGTIAATALLNLYVQVYEGMTPLTTTITLDNQTWPQWLRVRHIGTSQVVFEVTEGVPTTNVAGKSIRVTFTTSDGVTRGRTLEFSIIRVFDGFTPTASVTKDGDTATITVTDRDGTTTAQLIDGKDGRDGVDGVSPTAKVERNATGALVTVTDGSGTTTAQLSDGEDGYSYGISTSTIEVGVTKDNKTKVGDVPILPYAYRGGEQLVIVNATFSGPSWMHATWQTVGMSSYMRFTWDTDIPFYNQTQANISIVVNDGGTLRTHMLPLSIIPVMDGTAGATGPQGPAGADGYSPTATVTQTASGATITVTDKAGTTTATVHDGAAGATGPTGPAGADGTSPTVEVAPITGGHSVTITDVAGAHSFDVLDGQDGTGATITGTLTGNPAAASDAIAAKPTTLAVGGNSTQDGTPTPEAPVEIESVDALELTFAGANVFDTNFEQTYSIYSLTVKNDGTGRFTFSTTGTSGGRARAFGKDKAVYGTAAYASNYELEEAHAIRLPAGRWRVVEWSENVNGGIIFGALGTKNHEMIRNGIEFYSDGNIYYLGVIYTNLSSLVASGGSTRIMVVPASLPEIAEYEPYSATTATINLQGHQLRSLPDGTRDELTVDARGYVTLTQRIGVTTTATTDGITATVGTDAMSTTGGLEDGATVIYKLATPVEIPLGTVTLPAISVPYATIWATGGSATPTLEVTYERNLSIVIANIEAQLAALATS